MNNLIIIVVVFIVAIIIGIMANSNYQEVASIRDQENLQLTLEDCKRLFDAGPERNSCFGKSINAFGTNVQKQQWQRGYNP
ncbi:MAG: hypothetical protein ACR2LL_13480 [Nitrosopumilus sp.]|uniref:hypothetical protein n=1 Tax=Nitrosopumilus sp. TaxID=2024843 RepID=UPI0029307B74|nr:hypothetical protein [Nitrosopumilus sp.]